MKAGRRRRPRPDRTVPSRWHRHAWRNAAASRSSRRGVGWADQILRSCGYSSLWRMASNSIERAGEALPYRLVALPTTATSSMTSRFTELFPSAPRNWSHVSKRGADGMIASAFRPRHITSGEDTPTTLAMGYISRCGGRSVLFAGDGDPPAQVGGDEPGRRVLPVVQRALRDLGDQPLPRPPGRRVQPGGGRVLGVGADADDVGEIQRVVMPPL